MKLTTKYFEISGYWKDDKTEFSGYIVCESHDHIEELEDQVFYYGLSENDIKLCIKLEESTNLEYVITSYAVLDPIQLGWTQYIQAKDQSRNTIYKISTILVTLIGSTLFMYFTIGGGSFLYAGMGSAICFVIAAILCRRYNEN
mgnify:CR=1 FL=1